MWLCTGCLTRFPFKDKGLAELCVERHNTETAKSIEKIASVSWTNHFLKMKLRTGIDLIEIERIAQSIARSGERFLTRIYTQSELDEVGKNMASLATRFAAKEAVSKALGCGIGDVSWQEIEILRGAHAEPILSLHGAAQSIANDLGLKTWSLTLSHTKGHAVAMVVAMG